MELRLERFDEDVEQTRALRRGSGIGENGLE
jgi:hypothetical protein